MTYLTKERIPLTDEEFRMLIPKEVYYNIEIRCKGRFSPLERVFNAGAACCNYVGKQPKCVVQARDMLGITLLLAKRLPTNEFLEEFDKIAKETFPYIKQMVRGRTPG